ncbi:MAG: competence/damage-inducible protein A [Rhodospirillaceae bacterium]|jgi:molybdenum cofactor synthesis domain-containing protein|nr:competence/damage-inducible protein A [Rhodospirillaceae bacterium]MBT4426217.1 competence/damage-inducible protein A [Rhodospirillaceae bacterium]MBT7291191.1 competence/damage-inducible protein A [Rhodospirillaceae bacterium]
MPKTVTAALLLIGNELLSGRTQDANLNYLAKQLTAMGIVLREARLVSDDEGEIVAAVNALRARYDYVFTTGGIGPTHDDITCESVAKAFGLKYILNPEAKEILQEYYDGSALELNAARLRMAHTPEGATLVDNPISRAPGFRVENVIVMAGIPAVMRAMFESIAPELEGGTKVASRSVAVLMGEGDIARPLGELQDKYDSLEIGSYPFVRKGQFGTTLVLRGTDSAAVQQAGEELKSILRDMGGAPEDEAAISDGSWPNPKVKKET